MKVTQLLLLQPWQIMSLWSSLCAQVHCHAGKGLGCLVPVTGNCNATAYKDILHNCVLPRDCDHLALPIQICNGTITQILYGVYTVNST